MSAILERGSYREGEGKYLFAQPSPSLVGSTICGVQVVSVEISSEHDDVIIETENYTFTSSARTSVTIDAGSIEMTPAVKEWHNRELTKRFAADIIESIGKRNFDPEKKLWASRGQKLKDLLREIEDDK